MTDTFKSKGVNATQYKTTEIIDSLIETGTIYAINKYRVRVKERLVQNKKYYIADTGFTQLLDFPSLGTNLENIVYIKLLKNDYEIFYGDNNGEEIDLVDFKQNQTLNVQVSLSVADKSTYIREINSLNQVTGKKILITENDKKDLIRDDVEYYDIISFLNNFK